MYIQKCTAPDRIRDREMKVNEWLGIERINEIVEGD